MILSACSGAIEDAGSAPVLPGSAGAAAIDPVTGQPLDPATGLPLDPAGGDPADPAAGDPADPTAGDPAAQAAVHPAPTLRRLTLPQYRASVRDLLGVDVDTTQLTPVPALNGLRVVGASSIALGERDLERFGELADEVATQVFTDPAARQARVGCDAADDACLASFVADFGRRVYRRPLTDEEQTRLTDLGRLARERTGDAWLAVSFVTQALLQSPHFLYRVELGAPDPADATRRVLSGYELATRMSYFAWGTTPDGALLDAAATGALDDAASLRAEAQRLLDSPRASQAIDDFYRDYLHLDSLDALDKLPDAFPQLTDTLGPAMARETLEMLRTLTFERGVDVRELFTTRTTFIDAELARLYGVPAPSGGGFEEVELPADGPRAGLLTQGSFLASHAHPSRSSPTLRGKFIRESLLCQGIPPPPPDVDTSLPDTSMAATLRDKLAIHRQDPACAGCHSLMDPLGLALENFDAIGAYRSEENGVTIDASGELDGVAFADALGLGRAVSEHPDFVECLARTMLRAARGQIEDGSEDALVEALTDRFASDGHAVPALMLEIMASDLFRQTGALQ